MACAVDGTSPARATDTGSNAAITASFTAPANALLVACCEGDANTGDTVTVTVSDSGSLIWSEQVKRNADEATLGGWSAIHTAKTTSAVSRTVSLQRSGDTSATGRKSLKVYVVTGADVNGTPVDAVTANNEGGSGTNNLTTTSITPGASGLLFAADCDWNARGAFEASSDLTQDTDTYVGVISVCDGYKSVTSGVAATANLNAAGALAPQHKWVQIIVRELPASNPFLLVKN